jgi:hypothetical protein
MYSLGAIPSPNEHIAAAAKYTGSHLRDILPTSIDLRPYLMPVRDQGHQGSCVAMTCTCIVEYYANRDRSAYPYMSPQFFYNCRSNTGGGMIPSQAVAQLQTLGVCYEDTYRYGGSHENQMRSQIPASCFSEALGWTMASGNLISHPDDLKSALYEHGPCLITFPVYNYGGRFWKQQPGETLKGYHAVTVCGYNNDGFLIRNSWGASWNESGYTTLRYEDFSCAGEIWVIIDNPAGHPVKDIPNDLEPQQCCKCSIL